MRKIFLILFPATISGAVVAQVKFAVTNGINIANQINPVTHTNSAGQPLYDRGRSTINLTTGIFTELILFDKVLLRPRLCFTDFGYKLPELYDGLGNLIFPKRKFTLNYVHLPIQVIYPLKLEFGTCWIGVGPYAAILLSGRIKTSTTSTKVSIGKERSDHFTSSDFGISPTIGLRLKNGLLFGIDDNIGLADVSSQAGRNRNSSWSIYVGYVFK